MYKVLMVKQWDTFVLNPTRCTIKLVTKSKFWFKLTIFVPMQCKPTSTT